MVLGNGRPIHLVRNSTGGRQSWAVLWWPLCHHLLSNLYSTAIFPHAGVNFSCQIRVIFYQRASSCKPAPPEESGEAKSKESQEAEKKHTPPRKRRVLPQLSSVPSQALSPRLLLTWIFCMHFLLPAYPLHGAFIQAAPKNTCPQEQSAFQIAKGCSLLLFTTPNTEIQASFGGRHHLSTAAEGLCLQSL